MLAALMFGTKKLMEALPNIHLVGVFIVAMTAVYRRKALLPLYTYVLLEGLFGGFSAWWIPYLYIWTALWGMTMLIPRSLPQRAQRFVYGGVCGLHGLLFGLLYAPLQALMFHMKPKAMWAWIAAGLPFDCIHAVSNLVFGLVLIPPLIAVIRRFGRTEQSAASLRTASDKEEC